MSVAIRRCENAGKCLHGELSQDIKRELMDGELFAKWGAGISRDRIVGLQQQVVADAG